MSLASLLRQTLTLYPVSVQNKFGKTSYSTGVDYDCRFQKVSKNIVTATNELTPINALAWVGPNTPVAIGDKATFGDVGYKVLALEQLVDGSGATRHYELSLQEFNL